MSGQHAAQQAAADSWSRKNEDKLIMIEQLQRELASTVDALSVEQHHAHQLQTPHGGGYATAGGHEQTHRVQHVQYAMPAGQQPGMLSMPQNKFGYQDHPSTLDLVVRLQVRLAVCMHPALHPVLRAPVRVQGEYDCASWR